VLRRATRGSGTTWSKADRAGQIRRSGPLSWGDARFVDKNFKRSQISSFEGMCGYAGQASLIGFQFGNLRFEIRNS
jgi:hypothetical protein